MAGWMETVSHIRAVLFEEGEWWSAQCLEYDIAAQAKTPLDLQDELVRVLAVHVAASAQLGREPFAEIKQAPQRFWDLYESAKQIDSKPALFRLENGQAFPAINPRLRMVRSSETAL
jgi:hypothetical protein